MPTAPLEAKTVVDVDPWLQQNVGAIVHRHDLFRTWKDNLEEHEGGFDAFTQGYKKFGFNVQADNSVVYREWAPGVKEAVLTGDFSELLIHNIYIVTVSWFLLKIAGTESPTLW